MADPTAVFEMHRPRLYGIAYRMLGSVADAEDMVQDAYLRWRGANPERVNTPEAWLVTTLTRLCIDRLRSARVEREAYVGPWLPEPVITDPAPMVEARMDLASDLSTALLVVLERLAPEERAAFLLHDVFDADYAEIGRILGKNETTCRQVVHRARERVRRDRPRFQVSETARVRLLEQFMAAMRTQDQASLAALFSQDATWTADGGGRVKAALKPIHGRELVARFAIGIWRHYLADKTHLLMKINGETGLVSFAGTKPFATLCVDTDGIRILSVFAVVNPDKLTDVPRLLAVTSAGTLPSSS